MIGTAMEYEDHRDYFDAGGRAARAAAGRDRQPLHGALARLSDLRRRGLVAILAALALGGDLAATIVSVTASWRSTSATSRSSRSSAAGARSASAASGLRVVTDGGGQVGLRASLIRNIIRLIEFALFYVPALISVLATRNNQRLGDLAAGTLVVRDTKLGPSSRPAGPGGDPGALRDLGRHRHRR